MLPNPNVTVSFYSDRIDLIEIGHQINIDMANFYTGSLICTAVKMQTIAGLNWNNQQHIRQYITLSTLVEDLTDILKKINQSVKQYKPTGPENLKGNQSEKISIIDTFTASKGSQTTYYIFSKLVGGYYVPKKVTIDTFTITDLFTPAATTNYKYLAYDLSRNKVLYEKNNGSYTICFSDLNGSNEQTLRSANSPKKPALTGDGENLYYVRDFGTDAIYRYNIDTDTDLGLSGGYAIGGITSGNSDNLLSLLNNATFGRLEKIVNTTVSTLIAFPTGGTGSPYLYGDDSTFAFFGNGLLQIRNTSNGSLVSSLSVAGLTIRHVAYINSTTFFIAYDDFSYSKIGLIDINTSAITEIDSVFGSANCYSFGQNVITLI
jgi:hypothetical protein